jgi:hypothetical protein
MTGSGGMPMRHLQVRIVYGIFSFGSRRQRLISGPGPGLSARA